MIELKNPTNLGAPGPIGGTSASSAAFTNLILSPGLSAPSISVTESGAVTSATPGISLIQTLSGSPGTNPFAANVISITDQTSGHLVGLQLAMGVNTWSIATFDQKTAFSADAFLNVTPTAVGQQLVAGQLFARAIAGVNTNGASLFASNFVVSGPSSSSGGALVGTEYDVSIDSAATWAQGIGAQCILTGTGHGTNATDSAFVAGQVGGVGWDYGLWWYASAFKTTSSIIGSSNTTNAKYGVDFNSVTFSTAGAAFRSNGFSVDSSGSITGIIDTANATFKLNGVAFGTKAQANSALSAGMLAFKVLVDFNTANTDYQIPITLPTGYTRYIINSIRISGASASLTTATCGLFTAAGGGGTALVAGGTAIAVSTASEETVNNAQQLTTPTATTSHTAATLYFRVGTAEGSAATGTVTVYIYPAS